jgi:outer membrane murein-binding lipoprotein Lpp
MHHRVYIAVAVMLAALAVSGCRTYGGHGSESANYEQMQRAVGILEEDLERARADLRAAQAAASSSPRAEVLATNFGEIVEEHARIVNEQKELLEGLSEDSDYRDLSRAFGAINTQRQAIQERYGRFLQGAYVAFADTAGWDVDRPYSSIPPYYKQIAATGQTHTLKQVLALVLEGSSPAPGLEATEPDTAASADSLSAL